ncbi:HAD-superfamily hydrolase, subfamily IIB [Bifidobacterium margollesii]|uniref:HAD-superfamily hydrolase, subfamily IIB n=1 Tax=Bifidobacterium margollesii TaxID=2020964 RepID=A0A2N5J8I6_9BIFI|nr:Cof-type HAD-IIB family hydrolase [Bifidobacterium margollesii]PLS30532.1 HAD-superfamily hydrolase, subfamily IIB [Bifidobacterium margollesii]
MASSIKAVFFDIDGTLTSFTTHEVPQSTEDAIEALKAKGIRVFIATGRAPSQMTIVTERLGIDFDGYVTMTGQYCFDDHGFLEKHDIDKTDLRIFLDYLAAHPDVGANFAEEDYVYFNQITPVIRKQYAGLGATAPSVVVDDVNRVFDHPTYQFSAFVGEAEEERIVAMLPKCRSVRWHPAFCDFIPADGGKPAGIKAFMELYGLRREETMAFGDGGNDADMLAYAGIGVAMGNGGDKAKAAADYVTESVDDDGVLKALRHFGVL